MSDDTNGRIDDFEAGWDAAIETVLDTLEQRLIDLDVAGGDMDDLLGEIEELMEEDGE